LRATAHPYLERLFQAPQLENAQDADFSAAAAEVAGAIDILKERGTPKQLKQGARVLSKAAEALRRVADVSTSGAGATAAEA
ncbi:MAG TPA: hypothetical protein VHT53_13345, partial [Candidatus Elarobacter sp.]|nr:hypothetical protein [Candidatus Elarobacter sp.]